jgi:hypothetical protein
MVAECPKTRKGVRKLLTFFPPPLPDSTNNPRIVANSWGKKRRPGTKELAAAVRCSDTVFVSFLEACFKWDARERWSPEEALQHPWLQEVSWSASFVFLGTILFLLQLFHSCEIRFKTPGRGGRRKRRCSTHDSRRWAGLFLAQFFFCRFSFCAEFGLDEVVGSRSSLTYSLTSRGGQS